MSEALYLGIDTGGTAMKFALTDRRGELRSTGEVPTLPDDPVASLQGLANAIADDLAQVVGVGLACAGIIQPDSGWLGRSPNLPGWENSPLGEHLAAVFGHRTWAVANDVNGALYGEFRHGAGKGCRNLIMIALGTGVGGGVILGGELVLGSHFGAGEIGHMVLDTQGPPCACGGRGCLEAYAGSRGLLRRARAEAGSDRLAALVQARGAGLTTADLAALAEEGDVQAVEIFAEAGRRLGQAVGNLVNVLDPDRVIIGGGVARAGELILGPCRSVVPGLVLAEEAKQVPVVPARLGNLAAALGAASLVRARERAAE